MQNIPELDRKGLREFALVTSGIVAVLFGLFFPWAFEFKWPLWPWILGGVLSVVGLIAPMALQPVYKTWMRIGLLLNKITTPIIMGIVFYLLVTPMGILRSVFAPDPMARKLDSSESYRVPSQKKSPESLEKPF